MYKRISFSADLQNDGNVWSVEQLDWVRTVLASVASWFYGQIHTEPLQQFVKFSRKSSDAKICHLKLKNTMIDSRTLWKPAELQNSTLYLEVNNYTKHKNSGNQVGEIWQVLTIKSFSQTTHFICSGGQQMEQGNNSSLELSSCKKIKDQAC